MHSGGGVMVIVAIRRESQPDYMGKHWEKKRGGKELEIIKTEGKERIRKGNGECRMESMHQ